MLHHCLACNSHYIQQSQGATITAHILESHCPHWIFGYNAVTWTNITDSLHSPGKIEQECRELIGREIQTATYSIFHDSRMNRWVASFFVITGKCRIKHGQWVTMHYDVMTWNPFPNHWPFVLEICPISRPLRVLQDFTKNVKQYLIEQYIAVCAIPNCFTCRSTWNQFYYPRYA